MKTLYLKIDKYEKEKEPFFIDGTDATYLVSFCINGLEFQGEITCDIFTGEVVSDKISNISPFVKAKSLL